MSDREHARLQFLTKAGWKAARRRPLSGDASTRSYIRLSSVGGDRAVLMDAPPETADTIHRFVEIAVYLKGLGLSAPTIVAADQTQGLLLLEDLGDDLFAEVLARQSNGEIRLYEAAADVLAVLHRANCPGFVDPYDAETMPPLAALAFDWYFYGATGAHPEVASRQALIDAMGDAIATYAGAPRVLALRDYHAENLIWLPERGGLARVGLLDFQDAMKAPPGYDLISLVEDARRDVSEAARSHAVRRYLDRTGLSESDLAPALATLGAQRNLRILGVFARLSLHYAKPQYIDLIPRVWAHLQRDLAHPALAGVARAVTTLPPPTPNLLSKLKELCGKTPHP